MKLWSRYKEWRVRRFWERIHVAHITRMVQMDYRWLGEFPLFDDLLERYLKMVSPDWYKTSIEDADMFRTRLRDKQRNSKDLINAQISDLMVGIGSSEDHEDILAFLRSTGLHENVVVRMHRAIASAEVKNG